VTAERHPGRALAAGLRALRIAEEIGHRQWFVMAHSGLGEILTLLRDLPAARQHMEAALACAREIDSVFWTRRVLAQLGSLSALEGDFDRAAASLDAALGPNAPMETIDERMVWCARIDLALASGNPSQALTITERLMATMSTDEGGRPEHLPALEHLRGEALAALGHGEEAETALRAVAATAEEDGLLPLLWSARLALGKLARGRSLRDGSEREFALAHAAMEAFAAEIDDEDRRETFLQYATGALPMRRPRSQRQAAKAAYGGLTGRERDVAVLVARGLTNPEIAEALFISRETARTHVGNILSKLGLKSRAQIAAWVQEHGLSVLDSQNQG
jgi:DNA-binding CsgD family transcriptional regulator